MRGFFLNFTFMAGDRVRLARGFTVVSLSLTHTLALVYKHTHAGFLCWLFCCSRHGRKEGGSSEEREKRWRGWECERNGEEVR